MDSVQSHCQDKGVDFFILFYLTTIILTCGGSRSAASADVRDTWHFCTSTFVHQALPPNVEITAGATVFFSLNHSSNWKAYIVIEMVTIDIGTMPLAACPPRSTDRTERKKQ